MASREACISPSAFGLITYKGFALDYIHAALRRDYIQRLRRLIADYVRAAPNATTNYRVFARC